MSYEVEISNFAGPLDALLKLIESNELEVTSVSLAAVTEQYLSLLANFDESSTEDLHEFIAVAAQLIYIKSCALLPEAGYEMEVEAAEGLAEQLREYQRYQKAAQLMAGSGYRQSYNRPVAPELFKEITPPLDSERLQRIYVAMADNKKPQLEATVPKRRQFTLEQGRKRLIDILQESEEPLSLQKIIETTEIRVEGVVLFLAALDLQRNREIKLRQMSRFGDIILEVWQPAN